MQIAQKLHQISVQFAQALSAVALDLYLYSKWPTSKTDKLKQIEPASQRHVVAPRCRMTVVGPKITEAWPLLKDGSFRQNFGRIVDKLERN
jgi:hypothetical protein